MIEAPASTLATALEKGTPRVPRRHQTVATMRTPRRPIFLKLCGTRRMSQSGTLQDQKISFFSKRPSFRSIVDLADRSTLSDAITPTLTGGIQWLETNIIRQPNNTTMQQSPIAPQPNIMARATMQRARSTLQTHSNILRMPANLASRPTPKVNSRSNVPRRRKEPSVSAGGFYFVHFSYHRGSGGLN